MGCCIVMALANARKGVSGRLPKDAQPIPSADPRVAKILKDLQGEWRIIPVNTQNKTYKENRHTKTVGFQTAYVSGNHYTLSGGNASRIQQYSFDFFQDPIDSSKLYCDKWGSIIIDIDAEKGIVKLNNGLNIDIIWKRTDDWYMNQQKKSQNEANVQDNQAPPPYSTEGN